VEVHDVLCATFLTLLASEERRPDMLAPELIAGRQCASLSIRRHWLNTTTLRPWDSAS
jgi:hypothetical protein